METIESSIPAFLRRGVTISYFQCDEKSPPVSDRLNMHVINGAMVAAHSLRSHAGRGSEGHCYECDILMARMTSSTRIAVKVGIFEDPFLEEPHQDVTFKAVSEGHCFQGDILMARMTSSTRTVVKVARSWWFMIYGRDAVAVTVRTPAIFESMKS